MGGRWKYDHVRQFGLASILLFALSATVWSQGLALSGIGPVNQSMGGASTAAPIDAAGALHWNPASISGLESSEVTFGVAISLPKEELSSSLAFPAISGSDRGEPGAAPLPHVAWVEKIDGSPWTLGLGVFAIGGFRTNYPANTTNPILSPQPPLGVGVGRILTEADILQLTPTLSYALNDYFSIGVAPTLTMAKLAIDPLLLAPPDDANNDGFPRYPTGDGSRWLWGGGFQLGIYYIGPDGWHWGASLKSPQWFEKARFKTSDELGRPRTITSNFDYPLIISLGTAYDKIDRLLLACDVRYFDYGNTDGFRESGFDSSGALRGLGWSSIFAVSVGAQYEIDETLYARLGYSFNQNPISDFESGFNVGSPVITQHYIYVGGSQQISNHSIFSVTYVHAFENDVSGPIQTPLGAIPGSNVTSAISVDALATAVTVRY